MPAGAFAAAAVAVVALARRTKRARAVDDGIAQPRTRHHRRSPAPALPENITPILESITDAFVAVDREWRFTYANREAERLLRRPRERLLGRVLWEEFPAAAGAVFQREYERAMATQKAVEFEALYPPLGKWFEVRGFPSAAGLSIYFRDVTTRRVAQERLRESEARYRLLADMIPQHIWTTEADGYHSYFSRRWYEFTGATLEQTAGEGWLAFLHPADRERTLARWRRSLRTGEPYSIEYRFRRTDGSYFWFLGQAMPLRNEAGQLIQWFGTLTDISDRKRLEEEREQRLTMERQARAEAERRREGLEAVTRDLANSETRYRLATGALSDALWDWNATTDQVDWSAGVEKLFGYPVAEVRPDISWWREHIHPDDRQRVVDGAHAVLRGVELSWKDEYRFLHRDGHYVVVTDHGSIERDARARAVRMVSAMQDVSALRTAQRELERSEEQFRTLANSIPQLAWMADGTGDIFWYNQRWYDYTGTALEEMRGWGWQKVHHPEHVRRVVDRIRHSFETGEEWEDTFPLRSRDGEYRRFLSRAYPIRDDQGRIVRWFGTNTDIEARLRVEEELQRRIAFEEQLIGIVSHDLRNPINAIQMGSELLLRRENLDERQARSVTRVLSAARRASRMIVDLLDFTRERMGKAMPLQRQPTDLHGLSHAVVEEVRMAHPGRRIEEVHEGDGRGAWDPDRLAQVLTNLLSNALAYSPPANPVRVLTRSAEAAVLIEVNNTGAPIPPERLPLLFQPFERGSSAEAGTRGIGLGLFIVDRVVRAHGGEVDVRSTAEDGTTFCVRLPRH